MIINSIVLLARRGYAVDVYADAETLGTAPMHFDDPAIRVLPFHGGSSFFVKGWAVVMARIAGRLRLFTWMARSWPFAFVLLLVFPRLFFFARWLTRQLEAYRFVIAVEAASLLALHATPSGTPIVYYDMELLDWTEDDPNYACKLVLKQLHARVVPHISRVAIQSPRRADAFARINEFDRERIAILPVAAMGEPITTRGRFFRDRFAIDDDVTLVVYSGNFTPWAKCVEIIAGVKDWPANYALVMHTWHTNMAKTDYFRAMQQAGAGLPVYFSTEYLAYEELAPALSSADIGILLYEPINENFTEILFSSNKLVEYLKAGLPVVCSDFPGLREFVESREIGVPVASPDAVPQAIARIGEQLQRFRGNAYRCYETDLRFERHFDDFFARLTAERSA